ncbi:MAG: lysophospholipase [Chthoniobacterales bacterium]|nr:lysophospholipase [Chthoniobacterales bacterium]
MIVRNYKAWQGATFSYISWEPSTQPIATTIILHGMGSFATEMAPLGEALSRVGIAAHAPNLRANGFDPNPYRRGHGFRYLHYLEDFRAFLQSVCPTTPHPPLFLAGESMGGLLSACFLTEPDLAPRFRGAILLAPVFTLRQPIPPIIKFLFEAFAALFPRLVFSPAFFIHGKDDPVPLTRDTAYENYIYNSPHRIKNYTIGFTAGVGRLMQQATNAATKIHTPLLLLNGGDDVFISPQQAKEWFNRLASTDKTHVIYPQSRHLLLHEFDTPSVLHTILDWIQHRLANTPPTAALPTSLPAAA